MKAALRRVIKAIDPDHAIEFDISGKAIKTEQNMNFALQNEILRTIPNFTNTIFEQGLTIYDVRNI
jgi:hypothetical protein